MPKHVSHGMSSMSSSEPMPPSAAIYSLKSALRKQMLATLRTVAEPDLKRQSKSVFDNLMGIKEFREARSVCCYLSMQKGELQTDDLIAHMLEQGVKLFTPYLPAQAAASKSKLPPLPEDDMRMLRLYSTQDLRGCPTDKWGILDPGLTRFDTSERTAREDAFDQGTPPLDIVLLPGVAFDEKCNRMGRGKGYYDRFLHRYCASHQRPLLLALALTPQVLTAGDEVPHDSSDEPLDGVVHPGGVIMRKPLHA